MPVSHVPYLDGNLQEWVNASYPEKFGNYGRTSNGGWGIAVLGEWRPNDSFTATMTFAGWDRGRSAVRIYWKDEQGRRYPMFMTDFAALLEEGHVEQHPGGGANLVKGEWKVVKRGANYGIQRIGDL